MTAQITPAAATPVAIPPQSGALDSFESVHFADAYAIRLPAHASRDPEILARFMFSHQPSWIGGLMRIRDAIMGCFGLKTAKHLSGTGDGARADRVGIFEIYGKSENEIILGADDRHLDFRISVLRSRGTMPQLTISTAVHWHNLLGRGYIFVIAPFHRLIVKTYLRRAAHLGWPRAE